MIYYYQWRRSDFVISWSGSLGSARPLCKYILIYPRSATTEVTKFQKNIRCANMSWYIQDEQRQRWQNLKRNILCANIFSYIHELIMIIVTPGHQVILLPCSRVPESLGILLHLDFNKDWNNAIDQPVVHHLGVLLDKLHVCWYVWNMQEYPKKILDFKSNATIWLIIFRHENENFEMKLRDSA